MIDLRLGDYRKVLVDVECDALICDPPYSARTHTGHNTQTIVESRLHRSLDYAHMTPSDVEAFVEFWHPRTRGWMAVFSDHVLMPVWCEALASVGRYTFQPVPCVITGMTVRFAGDGPSSWAVYLLVARPRRKPFSTWGTLPGAYVVKRKGQHRMGGKPEGLMRAIIKDYSRPGDLICDPCAGGATTLLAAAQMGRRSVGAEIDKDAYGAASRRIMGVAGGTATPTHTKATLAQTSLLDSLGG